jgi:membrane protease YdiL (CAAX protease family)
MTKTTKPYLLVFSIGYITAFAVALLIYHLQFNDLLTVFLIVGVAFSLIVWLFTRNIQPALNNDRPVQKNEGIVLTMLVAWMVLYITCGGAFINSFLPKNIQQDQQWQFFIIIARKLLAFVLIPYFICRTMGFSLQDFGLKFSLSRTFTKRNVSLLIIMSAAILLFEYFFSSGAKPLHEGQFSLSQLLIAIPTTFLWLFIEAGLIEEFFFRAVLQSRLAALIKSEWGAILMGGLIFGLAHVPGLYLRGAGSEGINEQLPVWFWLNYCIVNMSIAGIFPGIIWSKTKNLCLVMILHAVVDLLPNGSDFIQTWRI